MDTLIQETKPTTAKNTRYARSPHSFENTQKGSEVTTEAIDPVTNYMNKITQTPLLKRAQEIDLSRKALQGDMAARDHLIRANLRLVVKLAYEYRDFGIPLMDLICEGNIGLIKAIERYDPDKGAKLSSYVSWWIRHAMKRAIASHSKTIRLPIHQIERLSKMRKVISRLKTLLDREPTDEEIANELSIPTHKVSHLKTVSSSPASLNSKLNNESESTLEDLVKDEKGLSPYENVQEKSVNEDLQLLLDKLPGREGDILRHRFGIDGENPMTLEEVSQKYEITRERVRQIQNKALRNMRELLIERERQRSRDEIHQTNIQDSREQVIQEYILQTAKAS